ncbi:unnamed protein product [Durusdinium trenchii]|uniref:Ribosome biogenesis protein NOP53 n=1 Tax=Durusdinium trenchii TaxID=1381693 RepID=A0ABP0KWY0_9DINO
MLKRQKARERREEELRKLIKEVEDAVSPRETLRAFRRPETSRPLAKQAKQAKQVSPEDRVDKVRKDKAPRVEWQREERQEEADLPPAKRPKEQGRYERGSVLEAFSRPDKGPQHGG